MQTDSDNLIFALDIGTRSVIGLVGRQEGDMFRLLDVEIIEHGTRAMMDGQIENIELVASVAAEVKRRLSERLQAPLGYVNVAAAGRALKTQHGSFELDVDSEEPITRETVAQLEMGAVDCAAGELAHERDRFYCVGHSVLRYYLDDYPIATLLEHKGKKIRAEIIATFLPREVVDSLYAVVKKIGSAVESLTLEPIAALNAIIPRELMMLNLALVDIGAGTSDIAVTARGSVSAYTMATVAGDEVTEALITAYLVDFATAERIKAEISGGQKEVSYTDILGVEYTVGADEVKAVMRPVVEELCQTISKKILEINENSPSAVFLVGGGSKSPDMRELTAKNLGIDISKVAVGGNNYIKKSTLSDFDLSAPEFATPIGIAITAAQFLKGNPNAITVNGKKTRLFGNREAPMLEVLLSAGYTYNEIVGCVGKRMSITVDGKRKYVNGGHPKPATILLNGRICGLRDNVNLGDDIELTPATPGSDAACTLADMLPARRQISLTLNGAPCKAGVLATVNGESAGDSRPLKDGDVVATVNVLTLAELAAAYDLDARSLTVNGGAQPINYILKEGDIIARRGEEPAGNGDIHITLNGKPLSLPAKDTGEPHFFVDLLNYVDIKREELTADITLMINGKDASFLDPLGMNDVAEIKWK